jgi:predicted glycosyltransferase
MTSRTGPPRCDVLVHSDHHIGLGHYYRAHALVEAAHARGMRVAWALGGSPPGSRPPPPEVEVLQLPTLVEGGRPACDAGEYSRRREVRAEALAAHVMRLRPRLFVVETFPFGRFSLAPELIPALGAVRGTCPRSLILCSLRDLPAFPADPGKRSERLLDCDALLEEFFDGILLHSDSRLVDRAQALGEYVPSIPLWFTGYVDGRPAPEWSRDGARRRLVVYAGSGAVGEELLSTALQARRQGYLGDRWISLVAGPRMPRDALSRLKERASYASLVEVIGEVSDIRPLLARAEAAVCQAGYNSCLDVLATGVPAVMVPVEASGDQVTRAALLERAGAVVCVPESDLSPSRLAEAVRAAIDRPHPRLRNDRDGAQRTAALWARWAAKGGGA